MDRPIYIFGHTNPDTDAICASIAYGELKKELGLENVRVFRLGNLSKETQFALDYFGVEKPPLLRNVKPQLSDISFYEPLTISADATVKTVWDGLSASEGRRIALVLDEHAKLAGIVSFGDILGAFMVPADNLLKNHQIRFDNMLETLNGVLTGRYPHEIVQGKIYTGSQVQMMLEDEEGTLQKEDIVITSDYKHLNQFDSAGCILLTDVKEPAKNIAVQTAVLQTKYSFLETVRYLNLCISVSSIMRKTELECFVLDNFIEDVIELTQSSRHRNFPILNNAGEIVGIFSRRHLIDYQRKKVILMDHNEQAQSVEGIEQAEIVEIIDHHRVANVYTMEPLFIRSEPVGASSTIVFKMYMENFTKPSKNIAGIMLSAILSDTLMFKSPTCTKEDREAAYKLAKIAEVDLDDYGAALFRASASLEDYSAEEILSIDRKEFTFGKYKAAIAQVNTVDFDSIAKREESLEAAMESMAEKMGLDLAMLMITDVVNNGSEVIVVGKAKELIAEAFHMPREDKSIYLPGVVSRKKQIVPKLAKMTQTL